MIKESTGILHLHSNHECAYLGEATVQVFYKRICTFHNILILSKPFAVNT